MIYPPLHASIVKALSAHCGHPVTSLRVQPLSGGSINQCFRIRCSEGGFFCKVNEAKIFPGLLEKELRGLRLLRAQQVIRIPRPIGFYTDETYQVLVLEWIEPGTPGISFWKAFGEQLALLHRQTALVFGLDYNNYMGSVPQSNEPAKSWTPFFIQQRLQPLVQRCRDQKLLDPMQQKMFGALYSRMEEIFAEQEPPTLLHGDLWRGNKLCSVKNEPCLIDPAVYYGHRSIDLAMSTLFGGFDRSFYEAYDHHYPFPSNYREQWKVCNLYPLLIHLLLFGKSYSGSIEQTLHEFA